MVNRNNYGRAKSVRNARRTSTPTRSAVSTRTRASYIIRAKAQSARKALATPALPTRELKTPRAIRHTEEVVEKIKGPTPLPSTSLYPMRINKYLALKGYATRRDADTLIEKKIVRINDRIAEIGDKVTEHDAVTLARREKVPTYTYLAYHKAAGVDTHKDDSEETIFDTLPGDIKKLHLFPVGRLDKASSGLILLTNDGRITDRLLNPAHAHEKTYEVTTKQPLRANFEEKMTAGVNIEGYTTKPAVVAVLGANRFRITLTEGKSHQIRRMVVALFNEVQSLKRTRIMNIALGTLAENSYRPLEAEERSAFLKALGLA